LSLPPYSHVLSSPFPECGRDLRFVSNQYYYGIKDEMSLISNHCKRLNPSFDGAFSLVNIEEASNQDWKVPHGKELRPTCGLQ
jgi:hypothetical protein